MTTYRTPPVDVVLEAPISLGMLAVWAGDRHDADMSAIVGRALDAALQAGLDTLQHDGGWALDGRRFERDRLDIASYRHYLAGEHADVARPHEHLYVAMLTASGLPTHRAALPEAAMLAQTAYSAAARSQLRRDGIELVRTNTPAGWELAAVADEAAAIPRRRCGSAIAVAEQVVPLEHWSGASRRTA